MCGIVGYIGHREAQSILIDGLKLLEYRGYDSAGIAVLDEQLIVKKTKGRLQNLQQMVDRSPLPGTVGIGHTRWATHGGPTDENSHPHTDTSGAFSVVHNGIIENDLELKQQLTRKGVQFRSDTDTEVIAHLLADEYDGDLVQTVRRVVQKLKGAFSIAIACAHDPDQLIAVRQSSPLLIGKGDGEAYLASDLTALQEHTDHVIILDDGEMAILTREHITVFEAKTGKIVQKDPQLINLDRVIVSKGTFDHYMLKEIYEQPSTLRNTMESFIDTRHRIVMDDLNMTPEQLRQIQNICIVACGTAYHAGLVGKTMLESITRIPTEVDIASEFRYRNPILSEHTLVIVVSQSGETADTLAALHESKRRGAKVIAITNVAGSSIARDADDVILTKAGPEIAVASTKAYTAQLMAFALFSLYMSQTRDSIDGASRMELIDALKRIPHQVEMILQNADEMIWFAESIRDHSSVFFIGRGLDYAVALEGSLKLKEISYIHSEAYPAGELKHGSLALIEEGVPVIALATQLHLLEKTVSNMKEVKARGGQILSVTLDGNVDIVGCSDKTSFVPETHPLFTPIVAVIPLQLLTYYTSLALGKDIDKPRNLAKSVTVE